LLSGDQFGVNVTIQFVVNIVVADVLEGAATGGAFEAFDVKVLFLDPHKHAPAAQQKLGHTQNNYSLRSNWTPFPHDGTNYSKASQALLF